MKLDILVFAAHPDDAELACAGTILRQIDQGYAVGLVDMTKGEMGTRGTPEVRAVESEHAKEILGLSVRLNLGLEDGFLFENKQTLLSIVHAIRTYKPEMLLINSPEDRHPDHGAASKIVSRASFLAGLTKIETPGLEAWRPKEVLCYIQDRYLHPDIIVDVTPYWSKRMEAVLAYKSQFYDPNSEEPQTPISSLDFINFLDARGRDYGRLIGSTYGEGFVKVGPVAIKNIMNLI